MAWILDEYSKFHGHSPAVVTGKPIVSTLWFGTTAFVTTDNLKAYIALQICCHYSLQFKYVTLGGLPDI